MSVSRRGFLKLVAASVALGATAKLVSSPLALFAGNINEAAYFEDGVLYIYTRPPVLGMRVEAKYLSRESIHIRKIVAVETTNNTFWDEIQREIFCEAGDTVNVRLDVAKFEFNGVIGSDHV